MDYMIKGKRNEAKYRIMTLIIFVCNLVVSQIILHKQNIMVEEVFIFIISSLPYLVYSPVLLRSFIRFSTNASETDIKWLEEGTIINRIFYIGVFGLSAIPGFIIYQLL